LRPGNSATGWQVLVAPLDTPQPIIDKVTTGLSKVVTDPDFQNRLANVGSYSRAMTPDEVISFVKKEQEKWLQCCNGPPRNNAILRVAAAISRRSITESSVKTAEKTPLLQVDGLIVPCLVELCTPYLVHALMLGPAEGHGCPEPNVEIVEIFQGSYQFLGVELRATTL